MQLLRCEADRFLELAVYVRGDYQAYRQRIYKCECCESKVVRICNSSHNFMCSARNGIQICWITFLTVCRLLRCSPWIVKRLLFIGDVNAHHLEWLESPSTNLHGMVRVILPHRWVVSRWLRSLHTLKERYLTQC